MDRRLARIRIGIGGWTFAPWRGRFYPRGLPHGQELAYASSRLSSIEINGTFYRHQSPKSFAAWRDETPDDFVFAVKAHRATTHGKDFTGADVAIARFLESGLAELGGKLGPVLWQFPPTRRFHAELCEGFLAALPASLDGRGLRHAVEARHASFEDPAWIALLRRYKVAAVLVESQKQALRGDVTAGFVYARLQMNDAAADEGYASAALDGWATRLTAWAGGGAVTDLPMVAPMKPPKAKPLDCFAYFISGDKERAPESAMAMMRRLGA
jgi:uncharacterized protein YecE (DUF72 family)